MHTVELKPMMEVQFSGIMASIGISDVVTASGWILGENPSEEVME